MKIIQIMPDFGLAGAEIMCENLIYELQKMGIEVVVVSLYNHHSAITDRMESAGIRIKYLSKEAGLDFSMIIKLFILFKEEHPDVIHTHRYVMQYAIPAAIFAKVPLRIHTVHNIAIKENDKPARILAKLFYKFCNVVPVALSQRIKETIIDEYKLASNKVPVIFNGIDLSQCKPKDDYTFNTCFKILHIGRFSRQKNQILLLESFKEFHTMHSNSKLFLIGDGEMRRECMEYVCDNKMDGAVEFLGLKANIYDDLHTADIFILPSLFEGVPMTLIEAMGTGLPIIATNVGGILDMLKNNESAWIISCNKKSIIAALNDAFLNYEKRKLYGEMARKASENFSAHEMAMSYYYLYCNNN